LSVFLIVLVIGGNAGRQDQGSHRDSTHAEHPPQEIPSAQLLAVHRPAPHPSRSVIITVIVQVVIIRVVLVVGAVVVSLLAIVVPVAPILAVAPVVPVIVPIVVPVIPVVSVVSIVALIAAIIVIVPVIVPITSGVVAVVIGRVVILAILVVAAIVISCVIAAVVVPVRVPAVVSAIISIVVALVAIVGAGVVVAFSGVGVVIVAGGCVFAVLRCLLLDVLRPALRGSVTARGPAARRRRAEQQHGCHPDHDQLDRLQVSRWCAIRVGSRWLRITAVGRVFQNGWMHGLPPSSSNVR